LSGLLFFYEARVSRRDLEPKCLLRLLRVCGTAARFSETTAAACGVTPLAIRGLSEWHDAAWGQCPPAIALALPTP